MPLELIKPAGTAVSIAVAANARETTDDSQMDLKIYDPNSRMPRVNVPGLETGDVVHSVTRRTIARPVMPGEFAEEPCLERGGHIRLRDGIPGTVAMSTLASPSGSTVHRWEIPSGLRLFAEPSLPAPHDVALTFEKRYGVCRDRAALLVALLRLAGLKAHIVLTNVGAKLEPANPSVGFNHASVGVEREAGDYVLRDPTDETTRQFLPSTRRWSRPAASRLRRSPGWARPGAAHSARGSRQPWWT